MDSTGGNEDDSLLWKLLRWIIDIGINGGGILPSAEKVAADHLKNAETVEDAINSVIAWRTTHAAGTGFATGLGGIITLPASIPASMISSYVLGANTAAAVAKLRGYDVNSDQVQTIVLLCLLGRGGQEILRAAGVKIGQNVFKNMVGQIPGKVLIEINKKVGFRLITKAGEKGAINLMKMLPIAGGVVGATFDGMFVNVCGKTAKKMF